MHGMATGAVWKWMEQLASTNVQLPVVIAALNEEEGIGLTIQELKDEFAGAPVQPTLYVVDGQSEDRTAEIAQAAGASILRQTGKGKGDALAVAFKALPDSSRYVVITDADYTYPAGHIPEMLRTIVNDPKIGMVAGDRFDKRFDFRKAIRHVYYLGNRSLAATQYILNGIRMRDSLTGLRIVRYELVKNWIPKSKGFGVEVELNVRVKKAGFWIRETPIEYRRRMGEKKLSIRHGVPILYRIMAEALPSIRSRNHPAKTDGAPEQAAQSTVENQAITATIIPQQLREQN